MTERKHVGVERTILCAVRFWGGATVKLAPWTNAEYPGSRLAGMRRR